MPSDRQADRLRSAVPLNPTPPTELASAAPRLLRKARLYESIAALLGSSTAAYAPANIRRSAAIRGAPLTGNQDQKVGRAQKKDDGQRVGQAQKKDDRSTAQFGGIWKKSEGATDLLLEVWYLTKARARTSFGEEV